MPWVEVHRHIANSKTMLPTLDPYRRVAVALDFSSRETKLLAEAQRIARGSGAKVILLHVVESPAAFVMGQEAADQETLSDQQQLEGLTRKLREMGIDAECLLGSGSPASELARMINELDIDLVILGGHGHSGVSDLLHGTTVESPRH